MDANLRNLSIHFFVYEEPEELVQLQQIIWFRSGTQKFRKGKHSLTLRARFGAEAKQEDDVLEALSHHPLRTRNRTNANLFIIPFRLGSVIIGRETHEFNLLRCALLNITTFRKQPHVLLSLTTIGFNQHHILNTAPHGMDRAFYRDVAPLIVAQSWAAHASANVSQQGAAKGHEFQGMFLQLDHAMSNHGFSVGLLPDGSLPYYGATYGKFRSAKNFLFFQTRMEEFDWNSTRFRKILMDPSVMNRLHGTNSSIGFGLPPEDWVREFSNSQFCLAIRGDTPHTHSLLNAVKVGCIPVVVSDFYPIYAPSFPSTLTMEDYCIFIPEDDFIRDPAGQVLKLMELSELEIRRKLRGLAFAQKVVVMDHPDSLFVPAFLRESLVAYENPPPLELTFFHNDSATAPKLMPKNTGTTLNGPAPQCQHGTSERAVDLKGFFPGNRAPVHAKGLLAVPIGGMNAIYVDQMVRAMILFFDLVLFAFDKTDWSAYAWYSQVKIVKSPGGRKWKLAKEYLIPAVVNANYSHVCIWDDDLVPTEHFDAGLFLYILQEHNMSISQPSIDKNCHGKNYPGTCSHHTNHNSHFQSINMVEIQAPCYSRLTWNDYIWPHILDAEQGSGWGIDFYLHSNPSSEFIYAVHLPLDHMDSKTLKSKKRGGGGQMPAYEALRRALNWTGSTRKHGIMTRPERRMFTVEHYAVHVLDNCSLQAVHTGGTLNKKFRPMS
jgi:hypothetical protein